MKNKKKKENILYFIISKYILSKIKYIIYRLTNNQKCEISKYH